MPRSAILCFTFFGIFLLFAIFFTLQLVSRCLSFPWAEARTDLTPALSTALLYERSMHADQLPETCDPGVAARQRGGLGRALRGEAELHAQPRHRLVDGRRSDRGGLDAAHAVDGRGGAVGAQLHPGAGCTAARPARRPSDAWCVAVRVVQVTSVARFHTDTRLLPKSATAMSPSVGSTATPRGRLNWPAPEPAAPKAWPPVPSASSSTITRLLPLSAIHSRRRLAGAGDLAAQPGCVAPAWRRCHSERRCRAGRRWPE